MANHEEQYIEEIANGIDELKKHLGKYVLEMCTLLKLVVEEIRKRQSLPREIKETLKNHLQDIYWSLKLHMVFHEIEHQPVDDVGPSKPKKSNKPQLDPYKELEDLGHLVGLTDEELTKIPKQESAVDPWSKLIEILSATLKDTEESPEGSEDHAKNVMLVARDWLKTRSNSKENGTKREETVEKILGSKNIFRPKVLAMVSYNGKWSVGSSIAVSHFLRPLCLHKRIANFKPRLKKAIIFYQPLDTAHNQRWSSQAFATSSKWKEKVPCQNCARMFRNLEGFIDLSSEEGGKDTFLGACAEYCPVNQLLPEEPLLENDKQQIAAVVEKNWNQCKALFDDFREIQRECRKAYEDVEMRNEKCRKVYRDISKKVHIFGRKPECNKYFGGTT